MRGASYPAEVKGKRRKRLRYLAEGMAAGLLSAVILLALYLCFCWIMGLVRHPIQKVVLDGSLKHVKPAALTQVLQQATRGQSWLKVNLSELEQSVMTMPWVRTAVIERKWPWQLQVDLVEHVPVARWGDDLLITVDGSVLKPSSVHLWQGLVSLYGPADKENVVWQQYNRFMLLLNLDKLHLTQLQLTSAGEWILQLHSGLVIKLGRAQVYARLKRVVAALPQLQQQARGKIQLIDARYPDGLAVM